MSFKTFYESMSNDEVEILSMIEQIKKDCKPYLNVVRDANYGSSPSNMIQFCRGIKSNATVLTKTARTDRKPRDTIPPFNKYLNTTLKNKGTFPRSEAVFAFGSLNGVSVYGRPYHIYPTGNFVFYYIVGKSFTRTSKGPINDITSKFQIDLDNVRRLPKYFETDFLKLFNGKNSTKEMREAFYELANPFEVAYKDEVQALKTSFDLIDSMEVVKNRLDQKFMAEYMIKTEKYYAIHADTYNNLVDEYPEKFRIF